MSRLRELVLLKARKRLVRELCRALASGLGEVDVLELLPIALRETCDHEPWWRFEGHLARRCVRCGLREVVEL